MSGARTLLVTERVVAPESRARYVESLAGLRDRCVASGVQFWAFEHATEPGRFLEFAEARQPSLLDAIEDEGATGSRWHSVELG
jgi:hypothetical protein